MPAESGLETRAADDQERYVETLIHQQAQAHARFKSTTPHISLVAHGFLSMAEREGGLYVA